MTACREASACSVSSPILTTRRSAPGARSPATPDRAPRSWWYRLPAARRGRSATLPPVTGGPSPPSGRPSCAWPASAWASRGYAAWTTSTAPWPTPSSRPWRARWPGSSASSGRTPSSPSVPTAATAIPTTSPSARRRRPPAGGPQTPGTARTGRRRALRRPPRLDYRCFPPGELLIMERLAAWLTSQPGRFTGTPAFAHALLLLAEAARTLGHIRDHVQVRWYPPGSYVIEQGEVAAELFLILSGEAEMWKESSGGRRERPGRLGVGEFFGGGRRHAQRRRGRHRQPHLPGPVPGTAGQVRWPGPGSPAGRCPARRAGEPASCRRDEQAGQGVVSCDVSEQVMRKVEALSAYRSQFPLEPDMFPEFLLTRCSAANTSSPCCGRPAHLDEVPRAVLSRSWRAAIGPVARLAAWRPAAQGRSARRRDGQHDDTQRDDP